MQRITDFVPLEVCESIALLLDLGTVLTLRCTCKMFLNATNSWRVWANLARYIALEPLFSVPDEPLEHYTASELREWVLRRHNAQELIFTDTPARFEKRPVSGTNGVTQVELLRGGRWLLLSNGSDIFSIDCEATTLEPQLLISTKVPGQDTRLEFKTWTDYDADRLSLRVATIYSEKIVRSRVTPYPYQVWVTFYQLSLVGHGHTARLVSEPLHQEQQCRGNIANEIHFEGLNQNYFIFLKDDVDPELDNGVYGAFTRMQVLDYVNPPSSLDLSATIALQGLELPASDFYILPGNRCAVSTWRCGIFIYPIPTVKTRCVAPLHCFADGSFSPDEHPFYQWRSDLYVGTSSTIYVHKSYFDIIQAIRIPHQVDEEPVVRALATDNKKPDNFDVYVALRTTVYMDDLWITDPRAEISRYPWIAPAAWDDPSVNEFYAPGGISRPHMSNFEHSGSTAGVASMKVFRTESVEGSVLGFDEGIGRAVVVGKLGAYVYDVVKGETE